ncbi:hypothetical protein HD806DRAFT_524633 [Xylariaceae sp. AK1471]|nr:hypothetical protein HD806DRAFT_524633 [Xylariaceae sp. AK1471]
MTKVESQATNITDEELLPRTVRECLHNVITAILAEEAIKDSRPVRKVIGTRPRPPTLAIRRINSFALDSNSVNISIIFDDSRSYLAVAEKRTDDIKFLEYLYDNGRTAYLNRQNKWDWTPYYCVFQWTGWCCDTSSSKAKLLLEKGVNSEMKAGEYELIPVPGLRIFTAIELAEHLDKRRPMGMASFTTLSKETTTQTPHLLLVNEKGTI